jgi:hypothetical protein
MAVLPLSVWRIVFYGHLMQLIAQEDFIQFSHCKSYILCIFSVLSVGLLPWKNKTDLSVRI